MYIDKVPPFLFDFFDKLIERIRKIYSEENMKAKVVSKQAQEQADRIRATMKQQEALLYDRQRELQEVSHERDLLKKKLDDFMRDEPDRDPANLSKNDLENSLENRRKKIATLKEEKIDLADQNAKLKAELTSKKTEIITLQRRIKELEKTGGTGGQDDETAT